MDVDEMRKDLSGGDGGGLAAVTSRAVGWRGRRGSEGVREMR
jgi:hypothetical protein